MAGWRDQLQAATFRGVPFHVRSGDGTIGRRTVSHEYPGKDVPYVEDLGRRAREFTLEAFVLGADVMRDRDALIAALEEPGTGELVHPYKGRMKVAVPNGRWSQSLDQGGIVRFSITFQESRDVVQPTVRADTQAGVEVAADNAESAVISEFEEAFTVDGQPDFVSTAALANVATALDEIKASANGVLQNSATMPQFLRDLAAISTTSASLIRFPNSLAGSLFSQVRSLRAIALSPAAAFHSLSGLFDFGTTGFSPLTGTTAAYQQRAANQQAVINLTRNAALIEASRASSQTEFASYDDAIDARVVLADQLEAAAETAPDATYATLIDLRVAVVRDITTRGADLSRIVQFTPNTTLPALVVAHQLYGDAERETEIVARNRIRHPGFITGGQPLKVLT
ncbi:DNA circularization protein [Nitrosovibrio sp. Nv4]|uniref:DNA circularization protein n=1 Tax=Nitrosovibrio sp. Nv4 TaxID=1945880 RepID=UPI000BC878D7|nr:DNA circularization N-terminal domain-containing protein [Nitrosovibrio sp. Nv4]SOD42335.1 Mu-like prophage DNA circulation protein [Nitrosovibrio sp. Nv4]